MVQAGKVNLRPIERDDLPRFVSWFSDPEVRRHLEIYLPFSLSQEERWFVAILDAIDRQEAVLLAIETAGGIHIGNIGLHHVNWKDRSAELGIVIGDKVHWDQGYGTEATKMLLGLAFHDMNLHRVFLRVDAGNARGLRCYEKAGFQHEGTFRDAVFRNGAYRDQHILSILSSEFTEASPESVEP